MSNILIQYDWNNHKEVNQKKLTDMFMELCLSDRKKVYRILSNRRKLILRKGYEKWKIEQSKAILEKNKLFSTAPLGELLDLSDIKTHNEINLTLGIILNDGGIGYYDQKSSNYHKEFESFKKTKSKMITFYETMWLRKNSSLVPDEHDFYVQLKKLEYIPPTTLAEIFREKKEKYIKCYIHIGVGKERAERLSAALVKRVKKINEYDGDILLATKKAYSEWRQRINPIAISEVDKLYAITLFEVEEDY